MFLQKKVLWALGFAIAFSSASALAAPKKKKKKKKAPVTTEESMGSESSATAAPGTYGMGGCGLGSMVFSENTMFSQSIAGILNFTGMQSFAISAGTSNCTAGAPTVAANKAAQEVFVSNNLNALSKEAAQGEGETLNAFAFMLGCQGDSVNQFAKLSRDSYDAVYSNDNPTMVLDRMLEEVKADDQLATSCSKA